MAFQRANSLPPSASSPSHRRCHGPATTDDFLSSSQIWQLLQPSFVSIGCFNSYRFDDSYLCPKDPQLIITEAKEGPPQDFEEAKCFLALLRAEREVRRAEARLADRLVTKGRAWAEYNRLKAAKAHEKLGDAELRVGRARSILSENGFSCSELTQAMRRSEVKDHPQQINGA